MKIEAKNEEEQQHPIIFDDASEAATGSYNDTIDLEGWAYLDVHSNPDSDDFAAARVSCCDGRATSRLICFRSIDCAGCRVP